MTDDAPRHRVRRRWYRHTHESVSDGSPAMLVSEDGDHVTLINEDGYQWTDPTTHWRPIEGE